MRLMNKILSIFKSKNGEEITVDNENIVLVPISVIQESTNKLEQMIATLYPKQRELFDIMSICNKLQICLPTGGGKNYLMKLDLLRRLSDNDRKIMVISSHRLMLNNQHMNDIFESLSHNLGRVGFIFVGSSSYDISKFKQNKSMNSKLRDLGLSYKDILSSTISKSEMGEMIQNHFSNDRQVIIITTYHSLGLLSDIEIDTIYCDEAHTLATHEESRFKTNFKSLGFKNSYFFTATPKDCDTETDAFLMNNVETFGKREGLSFEESVSLGLIVRPIVHVALPSEYDSSVNFKSISNKVKILEDCFKVHRDQVLKNSYDKTKISPKLLVKCSSVDEMWDLHKEMVKRNPSIRICAGASRSSEDGGEVHFIDGEGIGDRNDFLSRIQGFKDTEEAIILHYDILSEGINVPGFTGVMFLSGTLPSMPKTLQNLGRSTRLHNYDRDRLRNKQITTNDLTNWVKPYCNIIIPYWDNESEMTKNELCKLIRRLRDEFDFHPVFISSLGSDLVKGLVNDDLEVLNKNKLKSRSFKIIEEIEHEIEDLDFKQKITSMDDLEFEKFFLDKFYNNDI